MKRKFLASVLVLVFLTFTLSGCRPPTYEELLRESGGYTYVEKRDMAHIIAVDDSLLIDGNFVVPEKINDLPVYSLGYEDVYIGHTDYYSMTENANITKITMNEGVDVYITRDALNNLSNLKVVEIKEYTDFLTDQENKSIQHVDVILYQTYQLEDFFGGITDFRAIDVEAKHLNYSGGPSTMVYLNAKGVETVTTWFKYTKALTTLILPSSVYEIRGDAFNECEHMTVFMRTEEATATEEMKKALEYAGKVVWGFTDEIVTFDTNGGSEIVMDVSQSNFEVVKKQGKITQPKQPTRKGYKFDGWFSDYLFQQPWDFSTDTVEDTMFLVAKWTKV